MQALQNPVIQQLLQNPELMRTIVQHHPLMLLMRFLEQHAGHSTNNVTGAQGLGQINEGLRSIISSARSGNLGAAGGSAVPGVPLIEALLQPALVGVGTMV